MALTAWIGPWAPWWVTRWSTRPVTASIRYATSDASSGVVDPISPAALGETVATKSKLFDIYLYKTSWSATPLAWVWTTYKTDRIQSKLWDTHKQAKKLFP